MVALKRGTDIAYLYHFPVRCEARAVQSSLHLYCV